MNIRRDIYVKLTDNKGIPQTFCDEDGNIVDDIDWGPLDVILRKDISQDCEVASVGYFACQEMGIIMRRQS